MSNFVKFILILVLAAVSVSSCRKEIVEQGGESDELVLAPQVKVLTKAPIAGTTFPTARAIVVSAYSRGISADLFSGVSFRNSSGGRWAGEVAQYWPASGNLDLLAYSADGFTSAPAAVYNGTNCSADVTLTVPDNSSDQVDILWAGAQDQAASQGAVSMTFNHAEAAVAFNAKAETAYNSSTNDGITIDNITLHGVKSNGKVQLNSDGTCAWTDLSNPQDIVLPGIPSGGYPVPTDILALDTAPFAIGGKGIVVIPQQATSFTVKYTIHNGLNASTPINQTEQFTYDIPSTSWAAGTKYVYTLEFKRDQVFVSTQVCDWTNICSDDVPVSIPGMVSATFWDPGKTSVNLGPAKLSAGGSVSLDWGDGTPLEIIENTTDAEAPVSISHNYSVAFDGKVQISVLRGRLDFGLVDADRYSLFQVYNNSEVQINKIFDYVQIGDTKWATKNLGATTVAGSYETSYGDLYMWGSLDTIYEGFPWTSATTTSINWKSGKGSGFVLDNCEFNSGVEKLPAENDIVQQKIGNGWRMPTLQDFTDLYNNCTTLDPDDLRDYTARLTSSGEGETLDKGVYWCADYDGVAGMIFCDGTNRLFFPAAGFGHEENIFEAGTNCGYWSSNGYENSDFAIFLFGYNFSLMLPHNNERWFAYSVRPACPAPQYVEMKMGTNHTYTLKWATKNLGATTVAGRYETCSGDYYAWGETETYYENKTFSSTLNKWKFTWRSGDEYLDSDNWLAYCGTWGFTEWDPIPYDANTRILKPEYDVVQKKIGGGWRMPTIQEFQDLYNACLVGTDMSNQYLSIACGEATTFAKGVYYCHNYDGITGVVFCDGANKLFFPCADFIYGLDDTDPLGFSGDYLSSTLDPYDVEKANNFTFNDYGCVLGQRDARNLNKSVRPVSD